MKTYILGTRHMALSKALLISTHNICFHGELREIYQYGKGPKISTLKFPSEWHIQTVQTQIRLVLKEQSDLGLHCLPFL